MINSPLGPESDLPTFKILIEGQEIRNFYQVVSVIIEKEINCINTAKIVLTDGDAAQETFPLSESEDFVPGKSIEIQMGYHATDVPVFKGVIISHSLKVKSNGQRLLSQLVLKCADETLKLTVARKSAYYKEKTDSEIMSTLISAYGLSLQVEATTLQHKKLVQYDATDWDFIMTRAEANGYVVICNNGTLEIGAPNLTASPVLALTYGKDVIDFQADLEAQAQLSSVSGKSWDPDTQSMLEEIGTEPRVNTQGNISGGDLAGILNGNASKFQSTAPEDPAALKIWASSRLLRSRVSKIRGSVSLTGSAVPQLGSIIQLNGFGTRMNGNAYVTKVKHVFEQADWITTVGFGLQPKWFAERVQITSPPALGLLPGIHGLQIGIVKQIDQDPDGAFRVLVTVPAIAEVGDGIWARITQEYASSGVGHFFFPEVSDEVVLGFLNEDPRFPIVLGALYSKKLTPPYTPNAENNTKAIVTKSKLKLVFDEDKKSITLETPGGNKIIISDDQKSITIQDQNNNKLQLSESGMVLDSPKDISIAAKGNLALSALGITLDAKADVDIQGNNINAKAKIGFVAQGTAQAALKASGQVEVKGAMVMIN